MAYAMQAAAVRAELNSTVAVPASPSGRLIVATLALPLLAASTLPGAAFAQDFTVVSGVVGQQNMLNVGDLGVIEAQGTISTGADFEYAVVMWAADQTLENFGLITTQGIFSVGIFSAGPDAAITNSGSIGTTQADGIGSTGANATITNSGSIATIGNVDFGIATDGLNATISNSGSITTQGLHAYSINSFGEHATISNSGSIRTSGNNAYGISSFGANATISNSGSIVTTANNANGIFANVGANVSISNSGSIVTAGSNAIGISSTGPNATITNSGSIIAEQADAISFTQGGATLNLLAGTVVQSGLSFTGAGNTVSFGPGFNALMTFSGNGIPGTVVAGGNPFAVSGNTVAVLDRGGFVLADDLALALAGDIAAAADGQSLSHCMPVPGSLPAADGIANENCAAEAWVTGIAAFGGRSGNADIAGVEHLRGGGLVGLEFTPGGGFSGGLFVGAVAARGNVGTLAEMTQGGGVVGGHAGVARDGYFADFYAALGILQIDSQRTISDNTVAGGLDLASATSAGYFLSPAVTVGADMDTGHGTLTPSLRLRYTALLLDGHAESGASDGLVVDDRTVHELELRAQLALALTPLANGDGVVSTTLRAGADIIHRQGEITGELLGQDIAFDAAGAGTRYRAFAGFDLDVALAGGASLFASLEGGVDTVGGHSGAVAAGIRGAF